MEYRKLGASGLAISSLSIGGWITFGGTAGEKDAHAVLRRALDGGVNFIDLADVYARGQAEEVVGRLLPELRRPDLVLSSKCFWPMSDNPNDKGLSRKHIVQSCEASLKRLGTDYLDLFFCHRADPDTPLEETVRAMDDLVHQGKILYWGTSVWPAETLRAASALAQKGGWYAPRVEQPPYSLFDRGIEAEVLPAARECGMGVVVWSPLAGGLLSGKYNDGVPEGSRAKTTQWLEGKLTDANLAKVRALGQLAQEVGCSTSQLALAWVMAQPGVTSVITGASRAEQVTENLGAAEVVMDKALRAKVEKIFPV